MSTGWNTPSRARVRVVFTSLVTVAAFALVGNLHAAYPSVPGDSGFEGGDGNLVRDGSSGAAFDWNSHDEATWSGSNPLYRRANRTDSGWKFTGLTDAGNNGADSVFGGGTKQDNECATVRSGPKPPNKDDLERVYFSHKTIPVTRSGVTTDHVFLSLAWMRIPQNTTNASAHVAFEFNQGATPCAGPGGLVQRDAGDMLVVYDFEGSATDSPTLKLLRWLEGTTFQPGSTCEVGSARPCWGGAVNLTQLGFAVAKVNTSDVSNPVLDLVAEGDDQLGTNEFGEATIDLTDAGIFTPGVCLSFGTGFGVSRSSGNSAQAQMKDLVGPGALDLRNCGALRILKQSTGSGNPRVTTAGATFTVVGPNGTFRVADNTAVPNPNPAPGFVVDASTTIGEICIAGLINGTYTVTETLAPPGYNLGNSGNPVQPGAVATGSDCGDGSPADNVSWIFRDPPNFDIQVNYRDGGSGQTSLTSIDCYSGSSPDGADTLDGTPASGWDESVTHTDRSAPSTVTCVITVDDEPPS